jgi:hypothetical protein
MDSRFRGNDGRAVKNSDRWYKDNEFAYDCQWAKTAPGEISALHSAMEELERPLPGEP